MAMLKNAEEEEEKKKANYIHIQYLAFQIFLNTMN